MTEHDPKAVARAKHYLAVRLGVAMEHLGMTAGQVIALADSLEQADARHQRLFFLLDTRYRVKRPRLSNRIAELMVFWAPNDQGYSNSLTWAGRYTAERLAASPDYYRIDKGKDNRMWALPVEAVERLAMRKDPADKRHCDGPGPLLVNHVVVWEMLEPLAIGLEQMKAIAAEEAART